MMHCKILVFGGQGRFGQYLEKKKIVLFKYYFKKKNLPKLKIKINNIIFKKKINIFLNLIAETNIEICEKNKTRAKFINYEITKFLSNICKEKDIKFIQFSTDQLFQKNNVKFSENKKAKPLNYYAKTKLMAEKIIKKNCKNFLIIRTNFLSANHKKKTLYDKIYKSLKYKKKINLWNNVFYNPLHPKVIIFSIFKLIKLNKVGVFNLSSNTKISKFRAGELISKYLKKKNNFKKSEIPDKFVKRPFNMVLDNSKIRKIIKKRKFFDTDYNFKIFSKEF